MVDAVHAWLWRTWERLRDRLVGPEFGPDDQAADERAAAADAPTAEPVIPWPPSSSPGDAPPAAPARRP